MRNILAIGAHPDDIEISCLGYLLKEKKEKKSKVTVLILSTGSMHDPTSGLKRIKESRKALKYIKDLNFNYINNKGIKVFNYEIICNKVRKLILSTKFDEVLVHDPNDTNQEHILAYNIVKTAIRRLAINLIRYRSISSTNDFKANLYVDVKDFIATKKKSLKFHKSQKFHEYFEEKYIDSFHNNFFAYIKGLEVSESFFQEFKFL
jgi:LmbE family N-acetylglucosaminyl deacetylase